MLNWIIRTSLANRLLVIVAAVVVSIYGTWILSTTRTDVLPDLDRPVVTIMAEAPGMAPEEVEAQVTYVIESAVNGAMGVERVRSTSGLGVGVVYVEFGWGTDVYRHRQVVAERLATIIPRMPPGVIPQLAPVASIMGEIALLSLQSEVMSPMEVRGVADFTLRPAILSIPGIAQVTVMGGDAKQFRVEANPDRLSVFDLSMEDLEAALQAFGANAGGGFVTRGSQELVVRNIGRATTVEEIEASLVATKAGDHDGPPRAVLVRDVARVFEAGPLVRLGTASANGKPAVLMAIQKQPEADTLVLSEALDAMMAELRPTLPQGLVVNDDVFRQEHFIRAAISNVIHALRDGSIFVVIVLVLFLMNVRTTLITLTALPLSIMVTFLVFHFFGLSVNTMTLGGIAVAIGELVDDAVVDVENVFRRLRENRQAASPRPTLDVVYEASSEVRNPILLGTIIVMLVFLPTLFLPGLEGQLFRPLAVAYLLSIFASLIVALTLTPVMASFLLPRMKRMSHTADGFVLRFFKQLALKSYSISLPRPWLVISGCAVLVAAAIVGVLRLGSEFLPPFNEGTAVVNFFLTPGISLAESDALGQRAERMLLEIPEVKQVARRTGRAEMDEHLVGLGVESAEIEVDFWTKDEARDPAKHALANGRKPPAVRDLRKQVEVFSDIEERLSAFPGVGVGIGQPISHRIEHLVSGIQAQVVIKIFGEDLATLRELAQTTKAVMEGVPGVADLQVEQQVLVPQLHVVVKREAAARYGFSASGLVEMLEMATKGKTVGSVVDGLRSHELVLALDDMYRSDPERLGDVRLVSPTGAIVLVRDVAELRETWGPNSIARENLKRRIVVACNVRERDLGSTVQELMRVIRDQIELPTGYSMTFGGLYEAQQRSTRLLFVLGLASLVAIFLLLAAHYRSAMLAAQIMLNVPFAFIGSVVALMIAGETLSVASMVGFISLTGIATRNGVLMISHYMHLIREEGMTFGREMVIRGSQERVAPVLMTALTAGLALVPLALSQGQPGREILHPVAVVILGGLMTSTALDFFVTPTVFLKFGKRAAERLAREHGTRFTGQQNAPEGSGTQGV